MRKLLFGVMLGGVIALITSTSGYANMPSFPSLVNYQGMLTDLEGNPLTGMYDLTFAIYNDTTEGTLKWKETQEGVQVQNGLFNVVLGKVSALNLAFDQIFCSAVCVPDPSPRDTK